MGGGGGKNFYLENRGLGFFGKRKNGKILYGFMPLLQLGKKVKVEIAGYCRRLRDFLFCNISFSKFCIYKNLQWSSVPLSTPDESQLRGDYKLMGQSLR